MTKSFTTRCQVRPSKKCFWARKTKLLTVFGAPLGSRTAVILPHDVSNVTVYVLFGSMVIGGAVVNFGRLGLSGGLVSLHWTAATAGLTVVVVVGPLDAVVEEAEALDFLPPPLEWSAANRMNRPMMRTNPTVPRMSDWRFFCCLAASSCAARAASRFWRWRSRFGSGMGLESKPRRYRQAGKGGGAGTLDQAMTSTTVPLRP